jgi:hypothetical protein
MTLQNSGFDVIWLSLTARRFGESVSCSTSNLFLLMRYTATHGCGHVLERTSTPFAAEYHT